MLNKLIIAPSTTNGRLLLILLLCIQGVYIDTDHIKMIYRYMCTCMIQNRKTYYSSAKYNKYLFLSHKRKWRNILIDFYAISIVNDLQYWLAVDMIYKNIGYRSVF